MSRGFEGCVGVFHSKGTGRGGEVTGNGMALCLGSGPGDEVSDEHTSRNGEVYREWKLAYGKLATENLWYESSFISLGHSIKKKLYVYISLLNSNSPMKNLSM